MKLRCCVRGDEREGGGRGYYKIIWVITWPELILWIGGLRSLEWFENKKLINYFHKTKLSSNQTFVYHIQTSFRRWTEPQKSIENLWNICGFLLKPSRNVFSNISTEASVLSVILGNYCKISNPEKSNIIYELLNMKHSKQSERRICKLKTIN